jgi:peptidoglycan/LPS O-acetylase OafA/YrhL
MPRLAYLDGMRGWAAIFVVLYHVFVGVTPVASNMMHLDRFIPFNGPMAVFCFFVISGFSLSVAYLETGDAEGIVRIAAARYVRLVLPIFAACLLVHFAMVTGLMDTSSDRPPAFLPYFTFEPTAAHLLKFSLFDVFFRYTEHDTYIGPLWTMRPELFGSALTFLAVVLVRPLRHRVIAMVLLSAAIFCFAGSFWSQAIAIFPLGIAVGDLALRGQFDKMPTSIALSCLFAGFLIPILIPHDVLIWGHFSVLIWGLAGAPLLIAGSIGLQPIRSFMGNVVSQWLGWISFPLYLVHGPMLCIVGEPLIRHQTSTATRFAIDALVTVLSILVAVPFAKFVNDPAVEVARRLGRWAAGFGDRRPASAPGR